MTEYVGTQKGDTPDMVIGAFPVLISGRSHDYGCLPREKIKPSHKTI